ncbi:hypothetical protein EJ05DRAFT_477593 [Pseudovirgaria hyperparasitica]|uniref:Uncharacterized protein n=1 Tax=Pseudovirgaria hyperparasitica TaxID=470096 RepID=A0A6A6W0M6_9PEZI|nr:uncharacterized protein EJ05DRAFT_477593 [Pseudovirgaria hyperparasitica]KAF2756452.1 hypothetical protein EJ05DRAFT_477593 [Pseudovirgaria hyperparasitica]
MSAAAENRWSRGGPQQQQRQNRQQGQNATQDRSGTNAPNRQDTSRQAIPSSSSGNAWAGQDRNSRSGSAAGGDRRSTPVPAAPQVSGKAGAPAYAPIRGFNSTEVKNFLTKNYKEAIGSGSGDPHMKVQGDSVSKRSSGVWTKNQVDAKNMANGQNFWSQLSLQVQKAEQGK